MQATEAPTRTTAEPETATLLIDTDIHEHPEGWPAMTSLLSYLPAHFRRYMDGSGGLWLGIPKPMSYATPMAVRRDWDDCIPGGLEALRRHLFEEEGISIGILNGPTFYPGSMKTDPELACALASAYNDYQVEHYLDPEPRLRGSVHVAPQMPEVAAREIDRLGAHPQVVQVCLPLVTHLQYGDAVFQPIWDAAVRNDLAVTFHHDGATPTLLGWPRYVIEWHTFAAPHTAQNQLTSMIVQGVFDRNPSLRVTMLEGGVVWIHSLIWRLDQQYREFRSVIPWVKRLPSEHIRDNVRASSQPTTEVTPSEFEKLVEMTRTERVFMYASDYPHYDGDTADVVFPSSMSEELRQRVRYRNAVEHYPRLRSLVD